MAQPVWVLSVDLQTKTATFTTGMAEAARSARGSFQDIKDGAQEAGESTGHSMMEARHGVMLLGEEFGVHLPRALTTFIASVGPIGAAMEAAFPFLAIAVGATLLLEHLAKLREAGERLTSAQLGFQTAAQNVFNTLDQKMLEAEKRADELRGDHLGALAKELQLIDHASLDDLAHQFDILAKKADEVFAEMKSHWYSVGIASTGAQHALTQFKGQYDLLLAQGNDKGASDLLAGTKQSAEQVLAMMKQMGESRADPVHGKPGDYEKYEQAAQALQKVGVISHLTHDITLTEVESQQQLVDTLNAQVTVQSKLADLAKVQKSNATAETTKSASTEAEEQVREAAAHSEKMLAIEREAAEKRWAINRTGLAEIIQGEKAFADQEYQLKVNGFDKEMAALSVYADGYKAKLQALRDQKEELQAEHAEQPTNLPNAALAIIEEAEQEKIKATQQGTQERLEVINAGIKQEEAYGLQGTNFYRTLMQERVTLVRQMQEEADKVQADGEKEEAEHEQKAGQLAIEAERISSQTRLAQVLMTGADKSALEMQLENQSYALQQKALQDKMAALDTNDKEYLNKVKAFYDQLAELEMQHNNKMQQLQNQAANDEYSRLMTSQTKILQEYSHGFSQVIMGKESFGKMMQQIDSQVASGMLQNAIMSAMTDDFSKERDAAAAARKAYLSAMQGIPAPANMFIAPAWAAMSFAAVMAFEGGTDMVPGVGRGDTVPAMLEPGEGVVPGGVMDKLRGLADSGGLDAKAPSQVHVHFRPTYHVSAIDGASVRGMLKQHSDEFSKHLHNEIRKLNR
jgi:hypothetical protein